MKKPETEPPRSLLVRIATADIGPAVGRVAAVLLFAAGVGLVWLLRGGWPTGSELGKIFLGLGAVIFLSLGIAGREGARVELGLDPPDWIGTAPPWLGPAFALVATLLFAVGIAIAIARLRSFGRARCAAAVALVPLVAFAGLVVARNAYPCGDPFDAMSASGLPLPPALMAGFAFWSALAAWLCLPRARASRAPSAAAFAVFATVVWIDVAVLGRVQCLGLVPIYFMLEGRGRSQRLLWPSRLPKVRTT